MVSSPEPIYETSAESTSESIPGYHRLTYSSTVRVLCWGNLESEALNEPMTESMNESMNDSMNESMNESTNE